ncbi:MAG: SulP family inorganic anion transporter [Chloroflexota bacterium]|jgi:SulP family sulfate permease
MPDLKSRLDPKNLKRDAVAGTVLGIESVPDGLASGLLAGVNPLAGLYGYLYGTLGGSFFTSSSFMAVQATGAMAIIVADAGLDSFENPATALYTLTILTGIVMAVAGLLRLGFVLRFVSNAVMTGFITAVGINIILGQMGDLTAYDADGSNRVSRAIDTVLNFTQIDGAALTVGIVTIVLILVLQQTRLGGLGMVVAIAIGSALAAVFTHFGANVQVLGDVADVPNALPLPVLPSLDGIFELLVPAIALAFVGLVQGAGVSAGFPNPDGRPADLDRDFIGQGAGNILAGFFRGMPVGGSMSASSLVVSAGARTRVSLMMAAGVMAVVILLFANVVALVAMPALAGLLITVGAMTIKPAKIETVVKTGPIQAVVFLATLVLTLFIPLQWAVLAGVALSAVLFILRQSERISIRRLLVDDEGGVSEVDPPTQVPASEVLAIQPYGSLFFAAASSFEERLPAVDDASKGSVVILRMRGKDEVGSTLIEVLKRYAKALAAVDSRLVLVTDSKTVLLQLERTGATDVIGEDNIYRGNEVLGRAFKRAYADAQAWVDAQPPSDKAAAGSDGDG